MHALRLPVSYLLNLTPRELQAADAYFFQRRAKSTYVGLDARYAIPGFKPPLSNSRRRDPPGLFFRRGAMTRSVLSINPLGQRPQRASPIQRSSLSLPTVSLCPQVDITHITLPSPLIKSRARCEGCFASVRYVSRRFRKCLGQRISGGGEGGVRTAQGDNLNQRDRGYTRRYQP